MNHRDTFKGFYAGLALVVASAVFFFVLNVGGRAYRHHAEQPGALSVEEIMQRLGEYDQRIPDCAGLVQGLTGYAYAIQDKVTGALTVVLACK